MFLTMLKSKIHRATVTGSEIDYEGSITIDADLIRQANMRVFEKVLVVNLKNGARVETYIIEGEAGSGTICMNGAAAHHFGVNDLVIIMTFVRMTEEETVAFVPTLVKVDGENRIVDK